MLEPRFDYDRVSALRPCTDQFPAAVAAVGGVAAWKARAFSFAELRAAGIPFADLVWLATEASKTDPDVARRVSLWGADCEARVLPIYERERPDDLRPRQAIKADRGFERGTVSGNARAAARAAWDANAAARAAARAAWDANAAARAAARAAWDANAAARAAWDAAMVAWDAEEVWQFDRLCAWMSADEPQDWPLDGGDDRD